MRSQINVRLLQAAALVSAAVMLSACAAPAPRGVSPYPPAGSAAPGVYPAAGYPAQTAPGSYREFGRVSNVEVLRTPEQGQGSGVGAIIGGVAGAVVGRQIGGGSGRDAATVAGVVGGALAGNAIEKNRNAGVRESYRVSIQLDNGASRIFDVPSAGELRVGDRVRIENGQISRI